VKSEVGSLKEGKRSEGKGKSAFEVGRPKSEVGSSKFLVLSVEFLVFSLWFVIEGKLCETLCNSVVNKNMKLRSYNENKRRATLCYAVVIRV